MDLFEGFRLEEETAPYERLARKALAAYGLEGVRLDAVSRAEDVLFRASDREAKTAYALRIHPRGWERVRILRGLLWLASLRREARLHVPEPVLARSGELVQSLSTPGVSGFRQITLVGWLAGQPVPVAEWSPEKTLRLGRTIGQLHRHAETFDLPADLAPPRRIAETLNEEIDPARLARAVAPEAKDLLARAVEAARDAMSDAGSGSEAAGLIHANLTPAHALFEEDNARLIGFTHCRWGHYAYDLATVDLALRELDDGDRLRTVLLEGYEEVRPLPADARDRLTPFAVLRLLDELHAAASDEAGALIGGGGARRIVDRLKRLVA
jgi:Ser/Thr protein kinase RdoA (MazF antagonist)